MLYLSLIELLMVHFLFQVTVRLVQWFREVDMTPLQLLFLVSWISQGMRYGAQLINLIECLCLILKLHAAWSKLAYANTSVMYALLSPNKRSYL